MLNNKSVKELLLERCGLVNALQRYRRHRWRKAGGSTKSDPVGPLLIIEGKLQQTVQKELCVRDQIENLRNYGALEKNDLLSAENLYQELDSLSNEYWWLEREWWLYRGNFTTGPLTKAFKLWRSNPRWYMHPVLREDCARRGGCCSRDCGCCVTRANDLARPLGHGHCTVECGCCRKARGFDFTTEQKEYLEGLFDFCDAKRGKYYPIQRTAYHYRLYRVSIWGIVARGKRLITSLSTIRYSYDYISSSIARDGLLRRAERRRDDEASLGYTAFVIKGTDILVLVGVHTLLLVHRATSMARDGFLKRAERRSDDKGCSGPAILS